MPAKRDMQIETERFHGLDYTLKRCVERIAWFIRCLLCYMK